MRTKKKAAQEVKEKESSPRLRVEMSQSVRKDIQKQMQLDFEYLIMGCGKTSDDLKYFEKILGINEKTLSRVLYAESIPHFNTIKQFYNFYFKLYSSPDLLMPIHETIKKYIHYLDNSASLEIDQEDFNELLGHNKIFRDLYLFSRTGPLTKNWVIKKYGEYGLGLIQSMILEGLIVEKNKGIYVQGPKNILNKTPCTIKKIILGLIKENLQEKASNNRVFYMVDGISSAVYRELLLKIKDFESQIGEFIFKNSLSTVENNENEEDRVRMFFAFSIDTISSLTL